MRRSVVLLAMACLAAAAAIAVATGVAQQTQPAHPIHPLGYVPYRVAQMQKQQQQQQQPLGVSQTQAQTSPIDILQRPSVQPAVPLSAPIVAQQKQKPVAITEPIAIIPANKPVNIQQQQQQQPVNIQQQQPIKLGTGATTQQPIVQQQQPIVQKPLVQQQPITEHEHKHPKTKLKWSGVQAQNEESSSAAMLHKPLKLKGTGQQQEQQAVQSEQAQPLSRAVKRGIMRAHRRSLRHASWIAGSVDLVCPSPSDCGISSSDSLSTAVLKHADISTVSTHTIMFPFVHPIVEALKKAPCNITLMAPAAESLTKYMRYQTDKYCSKGKWADTDACNTAQAIVELDEATVENTKNLAQQGKQSVHYVQMSVFARVLNSSIESWLAGSSASRREICTAETVFLPTADSFADLMEFVAQNANQGEQSDADIERIVQAYAKYKQQQQGKQQQSGGGDQQQMQSDQQNESQMQSDSEMQSDQQSDSQSMQSDQQSLMQSDAQPQQQSLKLSMQKQQQQPSQQQSSQQSSTQGDCPKPPYTPGEAASDFPKPHSEAIGEGGRDASQQQLQEPSDAQRSQSGNAPLLDLRIVKVSAFMQRAVVAQISHALLPFAYLSSDAPIHLVAPTMLVDPMFVNKNQRGGGGQQQQSQQQQSQPQQQSQQDQSELQDQQSQQSESDDDDSESAPEQQSSSPRSSAALTFGSPWSRMKQRDNACPSQSKMRKSKLFSWASSRRNQRKQMLRSRLGAANGADDDQQQSAQSESDLSGAGDSASDSSASSSQLRSRRRRFDDDDSGEKKTDADLDLMIARLFGVTPDEVSTPFKFSTDALFSSDAQRAQSVHLEKTEKGVAALLDSPMSVYPTAATIVIPDIRVRDAVLQVTASPVATPLKSSVAMKMNGLIAAAATFKAAGKQVADAVDYEPAITIFAPQDSSLTSLMQQLPKDKLRKLIRAVAKYKLKKAKVARMLRQLKRQELKQNIKQQMMQQQNQPDAESNAQYEQQSDADEQQQQQQPQQLGTSNNQQMDQQSMMGDNAQSDFEVNSGRLMKSDRNLNKLGSGKLKLRATDADADSDSDSDSESVTGPGSSSASDRDSALASAISSMHADLPFNLARWCERNGINVEQQATQEGQHGVWQPEEGNNAAGGFEQQEQGQQQQQQQQRRPRVTQAQLRALAQSHLFRGVVHSPDFTDGLTLNALSGASFSFKCNGDTWSFGGANILFTDIITKNAVIHVIDKPLGSAGMQQPQQQQLQSEQDSDQQTEQQSDQSEFSESGDSESMQGDSSSSMHSADSSMSLGASGRPLLSKHHKLGSSSAEFGGASPHRRLSVGSSLIAKHLVSWSLVDRHLGLGGLRLGGALLKHAARKHFARKSLGSHHPLRKSLVGHSLRMHSAGKSLGSHPLRMHTLRSGALKSKFGFSGEPRLKRWKLLKLKQMQVRKKMRRAKLKMMLKLRAARGGPCLFATSCQCSIVDSLALNPAWQRERNNPNKLFSASNQAESIQCSTDQSRQYSRDSFAQQTIRKCYDPEVYECTKGKLILKQSLQNQQQTDEQQQGDEQEESQQQGEQSQEQEQQGDQSDEFDQSDSQDQFDSDSDDQSSLGVGMSSSDKQRRANAGWQAMGD